MLVIFRPLTSLSFPLFSISLLLVWIHITQFPDCKIISQQIRLTSLLKGLIPTVSKLVYDILGKPSTAPYDDLKLTILEGMEEPELEFSKQFRKMLMNGIAKGWQLQKRDNSEPDSPQTDSDNSSSTTITSEREFDKEQSHTYDRECSKGLQSIAGDSNSIRGEKQHRPPEQAPAIQKRQAR
ncbi:hypothetical protein ACTXT7_000659 [Hymenolepis weldensis]